MPICGLWKERFRLDSAAVVSCLLRAMIPLSQVSVTVPLDTSCRELWL